jgi:hypothetical protein
VRFRRKSGETRTPHRRATHSAQRDVAALVVPVLFTAAMSAGLDRRYGKRARRMRTLIRRFALPLAAALVPVKRSAGHGYN